MADRDTLAILAEESALAFWPLASALRSPAASRDFLEELGWDFAAVPGELDSLKVPVGEVTKLVNGGVDPGKIPELLKTLFFAYQAIAKLNSASDLPENFRNEFPSQLVDYLLVEHLLRARSRWGFLLLALGVIRVEDAPPMGGRPAFIRRVFAFEDLDDLLSDPLVFFKNSYRWGQSGFEGERLIANVADLLEAFEFPVQEQRLDAQTLAQLQAGALSSAAPFDSSVRLVFIEHSVDPELFGAGVGLFILPETPVDRPGFAILPFATTDFEEAIDIGDNLELQFKGGIDLSANVGILVRPNKDVQFRAGLDTGAPTPVSGKLSVLLRLGKPDEPIMLLGKPDASRLEFGGVSTEGGTRLDATGRIEAFAEFALETGRIVIQPASREGDSFLAELLPGGGLEIGFDLAIGFSTTRGMYFRGSGGFERVVPSNLQIGPVEILSVLLAVRFRQGGLPIDVAATIRGDLSVLKATVENVGFTAKFTFPPDRNGNLGPVNFELGFKPPTGVGIAIDKGPVSGGGFLRFEPDAQRYCGAVSLRIYEIALSGFGVIETKLPEGQTGFSFVILISANFPPIQLGLGFTLNGAGGLLGVNRIVNTNGLQAAVRAHTLDHVLFPQEPEKNALAILNDLRTFFPATEGKYVFGPMALIAWSGKVPVLEAELGLILEFPEPLRLTILGQVRAGLPDKEKAFVKLKLDAVGVLDFDRKSFALDASLYDSNVGGFPISGDMAMRLNWGSAANFALAIGGFHPSFRPPPGFPTLQRVQVALTKTDNPRITIQGYLAITSNTAQIEAKAELFASKAGCNVHGWIGFDTLFTFQPFTFQADFSAGVDLRRGSRHIASVTLSGTLSGPNPWHAKGKACVSLLFFHVCVGFDVNLSEHKPEDIGAAPDALGRLTDALLDPRNWNAELPPAAHQAVSLAIAPAARPPVLLDPAGGALVRQRVVPLDQAIQRFETAKIAKGSANMFQLTGVRLGSNAVGEGDLKRVTDFFARGQFEDLPDAKKLSLPAFEQMPVSSPTDR